MIIMIKLSIVAHGNDIMDLNILDDFWPLFGRHIQYFLNSAALTCCDKF